MTNAISKYGVKAGDILYDTWGYEQTNVNFYKVTRVLSACKVELVEVGKTITRNDSAMSGECVPNPAAKLGGAIQKMIAQDSYEKRTGAWHVKINDCVSLTPWDGQPVFWSSWY